MNDSIEQLKSVTRKQFEDVYSEIQKVADAIAEVESTISLIDAGPQSGTTTQRPTKPVTGEIRFNTTTSKFEGYTGDAWVDLN